MNTLQHFAIFALPVLVATITPAAQAEWHTTERAIMGTSVSVELWHTDSAAAEVAMGQAIAEIERLDQLLSTWKDDSEISAINRLAAIGEVDLDDELSELISRALYFSVLTEGAFDITYASVGHLYDYRAGTRPADQTREAALAAVDYRHVMLDPAQRTIRYGREGVRIDLGGIAKGYAVERAVALLRAAGIEHAIVSAGGDTRILGDRRGRPWTVGIRDPRNRSGVVTRIPLHDEAISTSGDYERYFEADGKRYHHIIKPSTGDSPRELHSVTIIGDDATMTDALSTGVFVLGTQRGLALIERLDNVEAVIIDANGQLHYSSGLMPGS